MDNQTILGVFETLLDCLTWSKERKSAGSLVTIQRVRHLENGEFKNQEILLNL